MARLVAVARLRYFARVECGGPCFLRSLLRSSGGEAWRELVTADLAALRLALAPLLDSLADPATNAEGWVALVGDNPRAWKVYLKRYLALPDAPSELALEEPEDEANGWLCGA